MKLLLVTLYLAVASAIPIREESKPVDVIVNGLPDGAALNVEGLLGVKLNEHVDGELIAVSDPLYPYSVEGVQAAIAAQQVVEEEPVAFEVPVIASPEIVDGPSPVQVVESAVVPVPATPELIEGPAPIVLPAPIIPDVNEPAVMPVPAIPELIEGPQGVVLPGPASPEAVEIAAPETIDAVNVVENEVENSVADNSKPSPVSSPTGEVYNDGIVQVTVNAPEDAGLLVTIQSWFSMAINYVSNGVQTTQHIL